MATRYDGIGFGYGASRRSDPRIGAAIGQALLTAETILNVGAGAGSYEPMDREVLAVEPSWEMIRQRPTRSAPVVQARAESLPFPDAAFSAALAVLTVHHWADRARGLAELRRVARDRVVILTMDTDHESFWLIDRYLPEIGALDRHIMPLLDEIRSALGPIESIPVPIPHDCSDGFLGAYWRRPHAYLDPVVRRSISAFALISSAEAGLEHLERDLEDGTWHRLFGGLLGDEALDLGYRLVVAPPR